VAKRKIPRPHRDSNPDCPDRPARSLVAIPTKLSLLWFVLNFLILMVYSWLIINMEIFVSNCLNSCYQRSTSARDEPGRRVQRGERLLHRTWRYRENFCAQKRRRRSKKTNTFTQDGRPLPGDRIGNLLNVSQTQYRSH
jgi:hypothetical protein